MHARKACLLALVPLVLIGAFALLGKDGATPQNTKLSKLELLPQARLVLAPTEMLRDSFTVKFQIQAPVAERFQRHRCVIIASRPGFVLTAPKVQQWMLRHDTLMVLSEVDLTLRGPQALASALTLQFKFENLDRPKSASGVATLVLGAETQTPLPPQIDSLANATQIAQPDSSPVAPLAETDSLLASAKPESLQVAAPSAENPNVMPWILIGLLLSGFAVMALLSFLNRKQEHEAREKITPIKPVDSAKPATREEMRATSFEQMLRRREASPATLDAPTRVEKEEPHIAALPPENAVPAASVLALTPAPRNSENLVALPDLQSALAQLSAVTVEVQKAVGKQFDALQKLSTQVETVQMLPPVAAIPQTAPRLQFAFDTADTNSSNRPAPQLEDLGVRVAAAPAPTEKYEEIADAIASLAAASKIKTPPVSAQALAPKLELLQRLHGNLEALTTYCRTHVTGVSAESIEAMSHKVFELRVSYEAWAADQTAKLPLMLQRPTNGGENASRKIVESLLDSLYETRKLAAQGGLYFERRLAQLLEQDLPKLRAQFSGTTNAELQQLLERLV